MSHAPADTPVDVTLDASEGSSDGDALRAVLRRMASPVTVVTAAARGIRRGATIGSFTSVSLEPVLVSFNVIRGTAFHATLLEAPSLLVHLLGEGQAALAEHFARPDLPDEALFGAETLGGLGPDEPPRLAEALAVLRCRPWAVHEAGDHHLVIAEVEAIETGPKGRPLLYHDRRYRRLGEPV